MLRMVAEMLSVVAAGGWEWELSSAMDSSNDVSRDGGIDDIAE